MSDITEVSGREPSFGLVPRVALSFRLGTIEDIPWMDGLQKRHSKQLGYFPTKQFAGYVEMGGVLVATDEVGKRLGYCISRDRYLKRDELGVVYQMCVEPEARRSLVAAALLQEVFARSAFGCRLYCCWCAQDLPANRFWESMGFVPIAFRGGGEKKKGMRGTPRVHIFWQKRIVSGDATTPWWFPAKTDGGAMRGDRIVLPIPPGLRWEDEMPVMVEEERGQGSGGGGQGETKRKRKPKVDAKAAAGVQVPTKRMPARFGPPGAVMPVADVRPIDEAKPVEVSTLPLKRERTTSKCDPKLIAAARELRDRYLHEVNSGRHQIQSQGKYEVAKRLSPSTPTIATGLLAA
jgi:GNAT superfamily N-acetyltransferase